MIHRIMEALAPILLPQTNSPTMTVGTVCSLSGRSRAEVMDLLELDRAVVGTAAIPWAWNIATQLDGRRELRVLSACLTGETPPANLAEALELLFPPRLHTGLHGALRREAKFVTGTQFQRALNCSTQLVGDLLEGQSLQLAKPRRHRAGAGSSPVLSWDSVVQFLQARRL